MRPRAIIAFLSLTIGMGSALAQSWPERPMTFVVSNGAGSSPDVMARLLADRLGAILGQSVIVENKPGGSNIVGAISVARAAPDGYRFYFSTSTALSSNVVLVANLPYDPLRDFDPIAIVARTPQFLVVQKDVPARTLAELVALDKKNPGAYSIATDGPRNATGIITQSLNMRAGAHFVPVSYPNIMNGLQDTLAGRTQVGVFPISVAAAHIETGALRALGVTSPKRLAAYPDVPPISDTYDGFDFTGWFLLAAPHGTPTDIVKKMNAAVLKAMSDSEIRAMAPRLGFDLDSAGANTPDDARAFLAAQI